jgi:GH15 family glucan-1,4-alpha-glucosidase
MADLSLWPIGNCQVSALVDSEGGFVWGCAPQVDGDPLFCSLLSGESDAGRGEWRIAVEDQVSATQTYFRNTPILVTRLTDASGGVAEIFDFCPRFEKSGRMYRPVAFARIRPLARMGARPRDPARMAEGRDPGRHHAEAVPA